MKDTIKVYQSALYRGDKPDNSEPLHFTPIRKAILPIVTLISERGQEAVDFLHVFLTCIFFKAMGIGNW